MPRQLHITIHRLNEDRNLLFELRQYVAENLERRFLIPTALMPRGGEFRFSHGFHCATENSENLYSNVHFVLLGDCKRLAQPRDGFVKAILPAAEKPESRQCVNH